MKFGIAPETFKCTNLKSLMPNSPVNLERAAKLNDRNSGHFVQGHVDCTAQIIEKRPEDDSIYITLSIKKSDLHVPSKFAEITSNIVHKGFVAVDGTSLTVTNTKYIEKDIFHFQFMLIQFTQNHVVIPKKKIGETSNIEVDVVGKYVGARLALIDEKHKQQINALEKRIGRLETKLSSVIASYKSSAKL